MIDDRRSRILLSAAASGCLVLAIMLSAGGGRIGSDRIFPGLLTLLTGWAVMFNLLKLRSGREAEAFTVHYPNEGDAPERPMSPRATTGVLAVFWLTGAALLAVVAD